MTSALSTLSTLDEALLEDLLDESPNLRAIARKHSFGLSHLIARLTAAPLAAYLSALDHLRTLCERSRQSHALTALSKTLHTNPDPVEQRRSATTILRFSTALLKPVPAPRATTVALDGRAAHSCASITGPEDRLPSHPEIRPNFTTLDHLSALTTSPQPLTPIGRAGPARPVRPIPPSRTACLAAAAGAPP